MHVLENKPEKICALIGLKSCSYNSIGRAVAVMMAQAKRIYILMIEVNKLFSFFVAVISNLLENYMFVTKHAIIYNNISNNWLLNN